jgi:hypothetical protein
MFTHRTPNVAAQNSFLQASPDEAPKSERIAEELSAPSIELMILWGASVVHVAHLTPPRSFYVGEHGCDFALPAHALGAARIPVILVDKGGAVRVVLPAGAGGTVTSAGDVLRVRDAVASGKATPSAELEGASEIELTPGARAEIEIAGLTFRIELGRAVKAVAPRAPINTQSLAFQGLSTLLHASVLAAAAYFVPPLSFADEGSITPEQRYMIQQALDGTASPETAKTDAPVVADASRDSGPGASGEKAKGDAGKLGSMTSASKSGRFGIAHNAESPTPEIARAAAIADAGSFGMIGILTTLDGHLNAPTAPWGGLTSSGSDAENALGNLWGPDLGEAAGANGLTLSGVGESGGGKGEYIGIDRIGTIGDGLGNPGGISPRRLAEAPRKGGAPVMRPGPTTVDGRLPADVIQRVVRQNFGRYRFCYQEGLRNNPSLAGRVAVRFVIGRNGAVTTVANGGSDLPDAQVVSCVVRAFYGLSFPAPDNGVVMVTYPFMFSPGN